MPNPISIAFTLSAAEVNALDGTPVTIINAGADSKSIVHVPVRLEIWREAGTAYTVSNVVGRSRGLEFLHISFPPPPMTMPGDAADVAPIEPAKELWIRDADAQSNRERGQILFRVPMDLLENTTTSGMVVLPEPGLVLTGKKLKLTIEAGATISGGTGSLKGILYFDETYLPV